MALQVNESTNALLEADLVDEFDAPVDGGSIDSARLWITSAETGDVVNGRSNVDISSHIDSVGHLAFPLTVSDTALLAELTPVEWRNTRIVLSWDSGDKGLTERIMFAVKRVV